MWFVTYRTWAGRSAQARFPSERPARRFYRSLWTRPSVCSASISSAVRYAVYRREGRRRTVVGIYESPLKARTVSRRRRAAGQVAWYRKA